MEQINHSVISPSEVRKKQIILCTTIIAVIVTVTTIWIIYSESNKKDSVPFDIKESQKIEISKIANGTKTGEGYIHLIEGNIKNLTKQVDKQDSESISLKEQVEELEKIIKLYEVERREKESDTLLSDEVLQLKEELNLLKNDRLNQNHQLAPDSVNVQNKGIKNIEMKLENGNFTKYANIKKFNLETYLPANSYAPAVLISSVDASVGISAQSDPRAVLMRITGKARSAANRKEVQKTDLIGCTVGGAARGDLSSERIYIRLTKMTCSRDDGTVFETNVNGYISSSGVTGIRGKVISREGTFVAQSFIAGLVGGIGEGVSQTFASPLALPSGLATERPSALDITASGFSKGLKNSSNRTAEYLIERAEQYQPVISIPAGIDVEVVFLDGVYLDGRSGENGKN